jgi:hypothetical protein
VFSIFQRSKQLHTFCVKPHGGWIHYLDMTVHPALTSEQYYTGFLCESTLSPASGKPHDCQQPPPLLLGLGPRFSGRRKKSPQSYLKGQKTWTRSSQSIDRHTGSNWWILIPRFQFICFFLWPFHWCSDHWVSTELTILFYSEQHCGKHLGTCSLPPSLDFEGKGNLYVQKWNYQVKGSWVLLPD